MAREVLLEVAQEEVLLLELEAVEEVVQQAAAKVEAPSEALAVEKAEVLLAVVLRAAPAAEKEGALRREEAEEVVERDLLEEVPEAVLQAAVLSQAEATAEEALETLHLEESVTPTSTSQTTSASSTIWDRAKYSQSRKRNGYLGR